MADDPELRIKRELGALSGLRRVFVGNDLELKSALSVLDDPARWLSLFGDRGRLQIHLDDLDRRFFNYLASASSLWESASNVRRRLRPEITFPEWESRNPRKGSGLVPFLYDLRGVIQHDRITVSKGRMGGSRVNDDLDVPLAVAADFVFLKEQLQSLDYDKSQRAAAFAQTLEGDVSLRTIVDEFTPRALDFADWFRGELLKHR